MLHPLPLPYEKFYYLFELINIEKQLLEEAYESGEFDYDLDALIKEENEILDKLRNLAEYHILYSRINYVFRREGFAHNEEERTIVKEIEDYHLIKGKNTALSSSAASICYYIKGLCAVTNRQYQDAYIFFNKVKEILDRNLNLRADLAKRYIRTLSHLLYCYIDNKKYEEARQVIDEMKLLEGKEGFDNILIGNDRRAAPVFGFAAGDRARRQRRCADADTGGAHTRRH